MISLFVVMMLLSMLSLSSALKGARANPTNWLMKASSEMADKKGQRAREQKEFRTREKSLSVSVTRDWKSTLFKEPEELRQMLPSLAWESVGQPRICY